MFSIVGFSTKILYAWKAFRLALQTFLLTLIRWRWMMNYRIFTNNHRHQVTYYDFMSSKSQSPRWASCTLRAIKLPLCAHLCLILLKDLPYVLLY